MRDDVRVGVLVAVLVAVAVGVGVLQEHAVKEPELSMALAGSSFSSVTKTSVRFRSTLVTQSSWQVALPVKVRLAIS